MCRLFLSVDPADYEVETRAVRLHGHVTSIRLERSFWAIIEEIAGREAIAVARFVGTLHDEMLDKHGEVPNFASLLRVTCVQYLRRPDLHAGEVAERRAALIRVARGEESARVAA